MGSGGERGYIPVTCDTIPEHGVVIWGIGQSLCDRALLFL